MKIIVMKNDISLHTVVTLKLVKMVRRMVNIDISSKIWQPNFYYTKLTKFPELSFIYTNNI